MEGGHLLFCFAAKLGADAACTAAPRREQDGCRGAGAAKPGCHPMGWGERPEAELLPGCRCPSLLF